MYKMILGSVKIQADVETVGAAVQRIDFVPPFAEPPVVTITPMIDKEVTKAEPVRFALVSVDADHCVFLLQKGYIKWVHWHAIGRKPYGED